MIHIKKVMVPVDFSEASKKGVNYGLSLALEFEARLVLANIVPYDSLAYLTAKAHLLDLIPAELRERLDFELIVKRAARSRFAWYNRGARDSHCDCARPGITAAGNL